MPKLNLLLSAGTALIPLVFGFIWYNQKVFGNAWMKGAGLTPEDSKKMNMPLVFGLTYFFGFLISVSLHYMTIHQFGLQALLIPEMDHALSEETVNAGKLALEALGGSFRTFRHGVVHGVITGIFFVLPLLAIGSMFEFRGWKYILINAGYWIVCLGVMGGIICQFA